MLRRALIFCMAVAVGAYFLSVAWTDHRNREAKLSDFRKDLRALDFTNVDVGWDNETTGTRAKSIIEGHVLVNGCRIELERQENERDATGIARSRRIERITLDEVNDHDVTVNFVPTHSSMLTFLKAHGHRFGCS